MYTVDLNVDAALHELLAYARQYQYEVRCTSLSKQRRSTNSGETTDSHKPKWEKKWNSVNADDLASAGHVLFFL